MDVDVERLAEVIRAHEDRFFLEETGGPLHVTSRALEFRVTDVFVFRHTTEVDAPYWRAHARRFRIDAAAGFVAHTSARWRDAHDGRFNYPSSLFAPLRAVPFYDRRIVVPRRALAYLKGCYGEECLRRASLSPYQSDGPRVTDFAPL
jgi:hypothetical protein